MSELIEPEYAEICRKGGIKVKRVKAVFALPEAEASKEKAPRKSRSKYLNETEEEKKARLSKTSLEWYNKRKEDAKFKAERKAYANAYYAKRRAEREAFWEEKDK